MLIFQKRLGSGAGFQLNNASYDNKSYYLGNGAPRAMWFKPDGTKAFFTGVVSHRYAGITLSTPWDVTTASNDATGNNRSFSSQDDTPRSIIFKPDGTKSYMFGLETNSIYQFNHSTPWSPLSAHMVYDNKSFDFTTQSPNMIEVWIRPDGLKMYAMHTGASIYQYSLGTAWDITTATYDNKSKWYGGTTAGGGTTFTMNKDGTRLIIGNTVNDTLHQFDLSTGWDITTGVYNNISFSVTQEGLVYGISFKDGTGDKMYLVGYATDRVHQYSTP